MEHLEYRWMKVLCRFTGYAKILSYDLEPRLPREGRERHETARRPFPREQQINPGFSEYNMEIQIKKHSGP